MSKYIEKLGYTIQVDKNNSVCDFIFADPSQKELRSHLLTLYRGRPISKVLEEL